MASRRTLYHVTPNWNLENIKRFGVSPQFAQSVRKWTYWVDEERLLWALAHTSLKHSVPVGMLLVCVSLQDESELTRTHMRGVYARLIPITPTDVRPVSRMFVLDDDK